MRQNRRHMAADKRDYSAANRETAAAIHGKSAIKIIWTWFISHIEKALPVQ
ncbi:MAG: hypothetical protein HFI90_08975 [Clostridia bacterium]|nr:hypothetical protein [Clostridia bacterium]